MFRELGDEIIPPPTKHLRRRGSTYLQEKLPAGRYAAAWCTHSVKGSRGGATAADFEDQACPCE